MENVVHTDTHKTCGKCNELLPHTQFHRAKRNKDGLQSYCKECNKAVSKQMWRNPTSRRAHRNNIYRRRYGHSYDFKMDTLANQDYKCACCARDLTKLSKQQIHLDHCHETGDPRGVLCLPCNVTLGHYERGKQSPRASEMAPAFEAYLEGCA